MTTNFSQLPDAIKELLVSERLVDTVEAICMKHNLRPEEYGIVLRTTAALLSGTLPPTSFVATLMDELALPRESAALIAQDINREVFNPVKEALKEIHKLPPSIRPGTNAAPRPVSVEKIDAQKTSVANAGNPVATIEGEHRTTLMETPPPTPKPTPSSPPLPPQKSILEEKLAGIFQANTGVMMQPGRSVGFEQYAQPARPQTPSGTTFIQQERPITPTSSVPPSSPQKSPTQTSPLISPGAADPYREPLG